MAKVRYSTYAKPVVVIISHEDLSALPEVVKPKPLESEMSRFRDPLSSSALVRSSGQRRRGPSENLASSPCQAS